jgi:hypothetical protein
MNIYWFVKMGADESLSLAVLSQNGVHIRSIDLNFRRNLGPEHWRKEVEGTIAEFTLSAHHT